MQEVHVHSKILKSVIILKPSRAPEGVRMKRMIIFLKNKKMKMLLLAMETCFP